MLIVMNNRFRYRYDIFFCFLILIYPYLYFLYLTITVFFFFLIFSRETACTVINVSTYQHFDLRTHILTVFPYFVFSTGLKVQERTRQGPTYETWL